MNTNNVIVFCVKCGGHYNREETYPVKVEHDGLIAQGKFYICQGCYREIPEMAEKTRLERIK